MGCCQQSTAQKQEITTDTAQQIKLYNREEEQVDHQSISSPQDSIISSNFSNQNQQQIIHDIQVLPAKSESKQIQLQNVPVYFGQYLNPEPPSASGEQSSQGLSSVTVNASYIQVRCDDIRNSYRITGKLGEGRYSTVFKAVHRMTGIQRAIKTIRLQKLDQNDRRIIKQELDILTGLDHPNIIKVVEMIEYQNSLNIVLEYCAGGELLDYILSKGGLNELKAAKYIYSIISGIKYCHANGVIHRDLKPQNIMLDSDHPRANIKIIDFGTATFNAQDLQIMENLIYMSPEAIKGEELTEYSDIWSLGVIMYVILCKLQSAGQPPFQGATSNEVKQRILTGVFRFDGEEWGVISQGAKDLIMKMLNLNSQLRPTAAEVFSDPWVQQAMTQISTPRPIHRMVLKRLESTKVLSKFKQATLQFLASHYSTNEEVAELQQAFMSLDKDGDGKLTRNELIQALVNQDSPSMLNVDKIMAQCDPDNIGYIDYSQFLAITINQRTLLDNKRLEAAFKLYDTNKTGTITIVEIQHFFSESGLQIDQQELLNEIGNSINGEITFENFKALMVKQFA